MKKHEKEINFTLEPRNVLSKISISTVLSMITEPFDQEGVAKKTYDKNFNNPDSQYYKMSVEEIIESWKKKGQESLHYGRLNDEYIGIVLEGTETDREIFELDHDVDNDERLKIQVDSFNEFLSDLPDYIEYVAREKNLYYVLNGHLIKGRFDALLYNNQTNKYIIVDWKTSGTVDTECNKWTSNLLGPAKCFPNLNHYSYTIQVYFYKMALLQSGILPEGTTEDQIDVCIINFPGKKFEDSKYYKKYPAAFKYDEDILNGIFEFAIKKNNILSKKK